MTFALACWCVLAAALLPYVWTIVAKSTGRRFDNRDPREWLAKQDNPRSRRANAAQLNAFEAFAPFAAGVILARIAGVDEQQIALLALIFIGARILHGLFYVTNRARLRSLAWAAGFSCVIGLLAQAAMRAGEVAL
jgi:uncharacterized MAPEG superfamily protein